MSDEALIESLGEAYGDPQPEAPAIPAPPEADIPADEPEAVEPDTEAEAEPVEADAVDEAEPEFEVEVDGQVEVIRGKDQIKELLQKGKSYTKNSEVNARVRETLATQYQMQEQAGKFQQQFMGEMAELQALDQQLEQWNKVDFNAALDREDLTTVIKWKETRDNLRQQRAEKFNVLRGKADQFSQSQAQAAQELLRAEYGVLAAKLPEWRNSEKGPALRQQLAAYLPGIGYSVGDINNPKVVDHRVVLLAQKAAEYDRLQSGKDAKLKQVRTAPPVVKPGAKVAVNGKADFQQLVKTNKALGQKGNSRGQEALMTQALARAFKMP